MGSPERIRLTPEQEQLDQEIRGFIAEFAGQYINPDSPIKPPTEGQIIEFEVAITEPSSSGGDNRFIKRIISISETSVQTELHVREYNVGALEAYTHDPRYTDPSQPWRPKITYQNYMSDFSLEGAEALDRAREVLSMETK
jgi:hypothetical protein